ncbi:MAG: hypothetical protein ACE5FD_13305 [Anaerolineae bacterium]
MSKDSIALQEVIKNRWGNKAGGPKVQRYVGKFWDRKRREQKITAVHDLDTLQAYLDSVTLDDLVKQLRTQGITQKAFCESIGMTSRHLSAVKSSELRNRRFHELEATKLAVL